MEINEMICGAIVELSSSPAKSRKQLLPEVQRILSGMEFVVKIVSSSSSSSSNEECSDTNTSLSWDDEGINERKCETITRPRPQDPFVTKMSVHLARLAPSATYKPVRVEYPQVDFFQLNQRFIGNIPKPFLHPILGCSNDAKFYARVDHRPGIKNFYQKFPHGSE